MTDPKLQSWPGPIFLAFLCLAVVGCATTGGTAPDPAAATVATAEPAESSAEPERPAEPAEIDEEAAAEAVLERQAEEEVERTLYQPPPPPSGTWLKDEAGREYYVDKLEKMEGTYRRLEDGTVRTRWGIPIEVVDEDDDWFYYKVYRSTAARDVWGPTEPTEAEMAEVAAAYRVDLPERDRVTLVPIHQGLPQRDQWRHGFEMVDFDGDGLLDLVHPPARKAGGGPAVFLSDADAGWRRADEISFARFPYDYGDVAVADFNGDGRLDMALAVHLRGVVVLVDDGQGRFVPWSEGIGFVAPGSNQPQGFSSRAIVAVDWNGDGRPDVAALGEGPRLENPRAGGRPDALGSRGVVLFLNQGDGTWKVYEQGTGDDQVFGDDLTTGDFNGDELVDLASASHVGGRKTIVYLHRPDGGWELVEVPELRSGAFVRSVAADDLDGDGLDDLVIGYQSYHFEWRSGMDLLLARRDGSWRRVPVMAEEGRAAVWAVATGDLDGDGLPDVAGLTGDGRGVVALNQGSGSFVLEASPELDVEEDCRGYHAAIADVDGDGRGELMAAYAGEATLWEPDRCTTQGMLRAWTVRPADDGGGR